MSIFTNVVKMLPDVTLILYLHSLYQARETISSNLYVYYLLTFNAQVALNVICTAVHAQIYVLLLPQYMTKLARAG